MKELCAVNLYEINDVIQVVIEVIFRLNFLYKYQETFDILLDTYLF